MESLTGSFTNVALLAFQKSMKHHFFSVERLLYSILFLSVHSLHTLGTEFCLSNGGGRFCLQSSKVRTLLVLSPVSAVLLNVWLTKGEKSIVQSQNSGFFKRYFCWHIWWSTNTRMPPKTSFLIFLPVFQYLFVLLFLMSVVSFLCITDEKCYSWGVGADGSLPLQPQGCGI